MDLTDDTAMPIFYAISFGVTQLWCLGAPFGLLFVK